MAKYYFNGKSQYILQESAIIRSQFRVTFLKEATKSRIFYGIWVALINRLYLRNSNYISLSAFKYL